MASIPDRFRRQWLYSAGLVTGIRLLNADGPGFDLGQQILAAHNLLAGHGLSVYEHASQDLAEPSALVALTHFPAGYSLLAAALLSAGLGVGLVIKLLGAAATMLGWWGWARLAVPFFEPGLHQGPLWRGVAYVIATASTLLFTPPWSGTDIFLWAAIPWVLEWATRAAEPTARAWRFDAWTGALCGFAILMRYASLFLAVYVVAIIAWQSWPRLAYLLRRWTIVALGALPLLAVQFSIIAAHSAGATPGGIALDGARATVLDRLVLGLSLLHTWNITWAFWMPGRILTALFPDPPPPMPWPLALTALAGVFLVWSGVVLGRETASPSQDRRVLSLGLFLAVPCLLLPAMVFSVYDYVGDRRYYSELVPLSVFVAYAMAATRWPGRATPAAALHWGARAYCGAYAVLMAVFLPLLATPTALGATQRVKLMAGDVTEWPSMAVRQTLSPTRQAVVELLRAHPGAILVTSRPALFSWDGTLDGSRLVSMWCGDLKAASGPATVIIATFDQGQPADLWEYHGTGSTGFMSRASCFEQLPHLRVVRRFPDEGMKILVTNIEAGQSVVLEP